MRLKDKVAIVTGGSVGIGAAIAKRYAAEGATVATVYKSNDDGAAAIIKEITDAGGKGKAFKADVSKVANIEKLIADVIAEFGRVDILVNNAGVFRTVPVMETTEEIWDEQLDLNLKGYFFMVKTLVPHFRGNGGGKVVNISSIAGTGAFPNCPGYCASKGGVVNMTRALAAELGKDKINVNSIAPGLIVTDIWRESLDTIEGLEESLQAGISLRRWSQSEDIADVALWLASDMSSYVTGETIVVDGGMAKVRSGEAPEISRD